MFRRKLPGEGKGPRGSAPTSGSVLKAPPNWLEQQVIQGGRVPSVLSGEKIVPTLEAYQDGWGIAGYPANFITQPAATAGQTFSVYGRIGITDPELPLFTARIIGCLIVSSIVAAGSIVIFQAISPNQPGYQIARHTLGASPYIASMRDVFGDANPRIPPGYRLEVTVPTTAGGEVVTVNVILALTLAGFALPY